MDAYWKLLGDCLGPGSAYNPWLLAQNALRLPSPADVHLTGGARGGKRSFRPLQKVMGCSNSFSEWLHAQLDVLVNSHSLRPLRKLGEGGFAFVYLVKELESAGTFDVDPTARYALKKVLASTPEHLRAAQREIEVQQAARHPCILPLLDWSVVPPPPGDPQATHTVYMLSPAYTDGSLADLLVRLGKARASTNPHHFKARGGGGSAATLTDEQVHQQPQLQQALLSTRQVLAVFAQLCLALAALHTAGYAHRDVKTHNVLVRRLDAAGAPLPGASSGNLSVPGSREGSAHGAARYLRGPRMSAPAPPPPPSHLQPRPPATAAALAGATTSPHSSQPPGATAVRLTKAHTFAGSPRQQPPLQQEPACSSPVAIAADAVLAPPAQSSSPAVAAAAGGDSPQQDQQQQAYRCSNDGTLRGAERLRGVSPRTSIGGPPLAAAAAAAAHSPATPHAGGGGAAQGGAGTPAAAAAGGALSPTAAEAEEQLRMAPLLDASDWLAEAFAAGSGGGNGTAQPPQQATGAANAAGVGPAASPAAEAAAVAAAAQQHGGSGSAGAAAAVANGGGGALAAGGEDAPGSPSLQVLVQAASADEEQHPDLATVVQLRLRSGYEVQLMDFGSARRRRVPVPSRAEAMRLQEDAEANCTATFRAPELWDVPSTPCELDQACADVWSAGCTLFALMYGQSPFQLALNQGGSLALAVMNAHVPWPKDPQHHYPEQLHQLVTACLASDPASRPTARDLAVRAQDLMRASPPLPDPQLYVRLPPYPPEV